MVLGPKQLVRLRQVRGKTDESSEHAPKLLGFGDSN